MSQANLRLVEGTSVDKTKALDAALSQIERAFGKGSIMRLGQNEQVVEIETSPRARSGSTSRSASAVCRAAAWWKSTGLNPPARRR